MDGSPLTNRNVRLSLQIVNKRSVAFRTSDEHYFHGDARPAGFVAAPKLTHVAEVARISGPLVQALINAKHISFGERF